MNKITIPKTANRAEQVHLFDDEQEWAIRSAIAAKRPLLVRGEPGIGKTQLARAAAILLKRPFLSFTVDSNTEAEDLMWTFDAVERLAEAQVVGATEKDPTKVKRQIDVKLFVQPGPLWWAFDWHSASGITKSANNDTIDPEWNWQHADGVVILIDEIDKAESDVPNGLLEALGSSQFKPQGYDEFITIKPEIQAPLIIITTNEERALPNAFVRRCFVLNMEFPNVLFETGQAELAGILVQRGAAHFPDADKIMIPADENGASTEKNAEITLPVAAAKMLIEDRKRAIEKDLRPLPGQAEYLDLLRAVVELMGQGYDPVDLMKRVRTFAFDKSSK